MKNLLIILILASSLSSLAQHLNENGLYADNEGNLFTGVITSFNNDVKSVLSVKDGKVSGSACYYFSSGKIMETGNFVNGQRDGKCERFNENGTLNAIACYALGKKSGTWLVYDNAGNKRFEMNYSDGEKTGVWTSWDEKGSIVSTKDYSLRN